MFRSRKPTDSTSSKEMSTNQRTNAVDEKASGSTQRPRRALGDITNANAADSNGREVAKKPTLSHANSMNTNNVITETIPPQVSKTIIEEVENEDEDDEDEDEVDEQMEEDNRSYMRREADDIDMRDEGNPLLVTEYVNEMYMHFRDHEREFVVDPTYMLTTQPYVNEKMRAILIDWLIDVHLKFKMVPETIYMTVSLIDRYLSLKQVRRSRLQLVGVAAILMSAKYEEIYPPELRDLVYITDRAYTKQEILEMETAMLNALEYKLTVPTIHSFLCRYLKAAHADRTMVQVTCYLAERSLQEYSMLRYLPSIIAASAVLIARKTLRRHPWSPTLVKYTGYDEAQLTACVSELGGYVLNAENAAQVAVYKKYSSPKFGAVAKLAIVF